MKKLAAPALKFLKKSDQVLLTLCLLATIYGIILIKSSTNVYETNRYVIVQTAALIIGIVLFMVFSLLDVDILADKAVILYILSVGLIALLLPFGVAGESGNKAWIVLGPVSMQPAEIVKIPFVIIFAKLMITLQENRGINKPVSVLLMLACFGFLFLMIVATSRDLGSALVYFFIFAVMMFAGGVSLWWFLAGAGVIAAITPIAWKYLLHDDQKIRIIAPYDPSVDPTGLDTLWQSNQSKYAIASGGIAGRGLFQGEMTQSGSVPQQHTDFIFSAAGEEFGFIGCMIVILLLLLIIVRCFRDGIKCNYTLGYLICAGYGAMYIAQILENIGMCLGLTPVVGLTLPFFSYGGSSIITNFAAIGIVSGIYMRSRTQKIRRY